MEYTIIAQSALADHSITIFNLAGINIVDLFAAVRLADPLGRAIVLHSLLLARTRLSNSQGVFVRTAPDDSSLPAVLLRHLVHFFHLLLGGSRLDKQYQYRESKYRSAQQSEQLLSYVNSSIFKSFSVAPNNRPQLSKEQAAVLARKLMGNPLAVL